MNASGRKIWLTYVSTCLFHIHRTSNKLSLGKGSRIFSVICEARPQSSRWETDSGWAKSLQSESIKMEDLVDNIRYRSLRVMVGWYRRLDGRTRSACYVGATGGAS